MTRETLPRFDLYGELEVSPFASMGTIESAYRSLVKQHHPDVASGDEGRVKRLNLARDWLTDAELRRRYDRETDRGRHIPPARGSVITSSVVTRSNAGRRASFDSPGTPAHDAEPTFGIHADQVRQFLAELRSLDRARAQRVWNGRAVAHTRGYTQALRAAASAARPARLGEWQFAREAAGVIARGKLGDSTLTDQVADVLSDVAGAIAIRDLLSPAEYSLVLLPWTWRGTVRLPEIPGAAAAPVAAVEERRSMDATEPVIEARPVVEAAPAAAAGPRVVPAPSSQAAPASPPTPTLEPKPSTPFVAAVPRAAQPPSWPTRPTEPHARPPIDPAVSARLAEVLASTPVQPTPRPSIPGTPLPVVRPRETTIRAAVYAPPPRRPIGRFPIALAAASLILLLGAAVLLLPGAKPSQLIADATGTPAGTAPAVALASEPAAATTDATAGPGASDQPAPGTEPPTVGGGTGQAPSPRPGSTPRPTLPPGATPTPTPSGATPTPTPPPTPTPAPTPTPTTPPPTPTPGTDCTVITLINHWTFNAQRQWATAGFTGTVIFNPAPPPDYHIKWQSLAIGSIVPCSSDITVRDAAP